MLQWIKDLFSNASTVSSMRVMSMLCVITACGIAIYLTAKGQAETGIITVLLTAGITGKVSQKFAEKKDDAS